eukprot:augustus_masked-scaffold_3-processed-gene-10.2-mRNA-1 protein AED:0.04 eAED:0.04 QI:0/-1/0/1/-1/1/1/0/408
MNKFRGFRRPKRWLSNSDLATPPKRYQKEEITADNVQDILYSYAEKSESRVLLNDMIKIKPTGDNNNETLLKASVFLHHELKIRLAKCAVELENLPYGSSDLPSIKEVRSWYVDSFKDLYSFPQPKNILQERRFTALVKEIYERHSGTLWTMARGLYQLKQKHAEHDSSSTFCLSNEHSRLQYFLDDFLLSRIGIRVLIGQHVALHEHIPEWVGLICLKTSPLEITKSAIKSATSACVQWYGISPKVTIKGLEELEKAADDLTFPYIPAHLHHILFELLKNSMKATIENNSSSQFEFSEIEVEIKKVKGNVVKIFVRDEGGGIKESELNKIWSFMYTTASESDSVQLFESLDRKGRDFVYEGGMPIAGLGYGLPISKLFAKYLGGDIHVRNTALGTEAEVLINPVVES